MDNMVSPADDREVIRLVVVNGDSETRGLLARRLSALSGLDVVGVAGTVDEAVTVVRATRADVVVAEAALPDGSGDEVCRRVRAAVSHRCGCVVLSNLARERGSPVAPDVDAFVLKALVGGALEAEIRRVAAAVARRRVPW